MNCYGRAATKVRGCPPEGVADRSYEKRLLMVNMLVRGDF